MTNITGRRSKAPWVYNAQKFAFAIGEKLAEKMRLYKSENDPGFILLPPAHTLDPNHLYSKYPKSKDYILIENALLDKTDHKDFANTDHKTFVENALRRALNPSNAGNSAFKQKVFMMYLSDVYPSDGLEGTIKDADITKLYREGWDLCILEDEDADLSRDHSILSKNLKPDGRKCATVDLSLLSALRRATSTKEAAAAMNKCLETIARQLA